MNDQQTRYIEEQTALDNLGADLNEAYSTAQKTMPYAAAELAKALAGGLQVNQMSDDQKFLYKKFNLRIRTMVALRVAMRWTAGEYNRHLELAPQGVAKQTVADLAAIQAGLDDCNGTAE